MQQKLKLEQISFPKLSGLNIKILNAELLFYINFVKSFESQKGYYFRALFRCKIPNSGNHLLCIELIPAELLGLMPSGYSYTFNKGALAKKIQKKHFIIKNVELIIKENHEPEPLSKYLFEDLFEHISFINKDGEKVSFSDEIVSQYVIPIEIDNEVYLIPSSLIASKFYFFSSRVIPHILANTLENTYKSLISENGIYKIFLKSGYSDVDAPKIVFFKTDHYAQKSLNLLSKKYKLNLIQKKNKFPIYARFPFYGTFPCKLYCEKFDKIYYVHDFNIIDELLPYQKLKVEVIRIIKEKQKDIISKETIKRIPLEVFNLDDEKQYELSQVRPSKYIKSAEIRISIEKNEINLRKSYLVTTLVNKTNVKFKSKSEEVERVSVEEKALPLSELEKKIAPLEIKEEIELKEPEYIRELDNFRKMIEMLKENFKFSVLWEKKDLFPIRKKKIEKLSQLEYYDWDKILDRGKPKERRKILLLAGKFEDLPDKIVYFIEIDQKGMSYSVSTFIFINGFNKSKDLKDLIKSFKFFLFSYAEGVPKDKLIERMQKRGLKTYFKKHPSKSTKFAILSWCRRVKEIVKSI